MRARQRLPRRDLISGLNGPARTTRCLRFARAVACQDARLASGCWPDSTGWALWPTGFLRKVSSMLPTSLSSFPRLSLVQARVHRTACPTTRMRHPSRPRSARLAAARLVGRRTTAGRVTRRYGGPPLPWPLGARRPTTECHADARHARAVRPHDRGCGVACVQAVNQLLPPRDDRDQFVLGSEVMSHASKIACARQVDKTFHGGPVKGDG